MLLPYSVKCLASLWLTLSWFTVPLSCLCCSCPVIWTTTACQNSCGRKTFGGNITSVSSYDPPLPRLTSSAEGHSVVMRFVLRNRGRANQESMTLHYNSCDFGVHIWCNKRCRLYVKTMQSGFEMWAMVGYCTSWNSTTNSAWYQQHCSFWRIVGWLSVLRLCEGKKKKEASLFCIVIKQKINWGLFIATGTDGGIPQLR